MWRPEEGSEMKSQLNGLLGDRAIRRDRPLGQATEVSCIYPDICLLVAIAFHHGVLTHHRPGSNEAGWAWTGTFGDRSNYFLPKLFHEVFVIATENCQSGLVKHLGKGEAPGSEKTSTWL